MPTISVVPGTSLPSASLIDVIYPIGVIYESDDATPPNVVFGRGVWERIVGRMLIGVDEKDTDFNAAGKTGGEKAHVLTAQEMPEHKHTASVTLSSHNHGAGTLAVTSGGSHSHVIPVATANNVQIASSGGTTAGLYSSSTNSTNSGGAHTHSMSGTTAAVSPGATVSILNNIGGEAHNNMPPYRTTYMWRRTG